MATMARLRLIVLLAMLAFVGATNGADLSKWAASYDPGTKTRFIPVELWTGGEAWSRVGGRGLVDGTLAD